VGPALLWYQEIDSGVTLPFKCLLKVNVLKDVRSS